MRDEVTVGTFARLSGLSVHTLRHYDEIGLLVPERVDADTGYRYYTRTQLPRARRIASLRWIDMGLDDIRLVLDVPARAEDVLVAHRARLERQHSRLSAALGDVDRFLAGELPDYEPPVVARPVQIKLLVSDRDAAAGFYADAFGFRATVTQRTDEGDFDGFVFGEYGQPDFFLIHLQTAEHLGAAGPATIGLLVPDLEAAHRRALAAGAGEVGGPHEVQGMPRCSAVRDPDGNVVFLYQG
ncbi:MAG: MerR family transcriptional regulator [Microbacterium sp.]|jgi:DNA-binding transcriptional MerR regulator|nr:MerR family transcriptional regulator [Microbacterium sp.]